MSDRARNSRSVKERLATLGLEAHAATFEENDITLDVLPELTDEDLRELGLSLGHRKRLLRAIAELSDAPPAQAAEPQPEPVAMRGERRQVTLSFFDLVGSTELGNRLDPEDMSDLFGRYHASCEEAITRYGGRVSHLVGDGVLACFGYPMAHEDDAERAVRATLDAVRTVSELRATDGRAIAMRAGIATGVVVVGRLIGGDTGGELSAIGETPNLAARLLAVAEPGAVIISGATRHLIGDVFEIEAMSPATLKGFSAPVEVFRVRGLAQASDRFLARHAHGIHRLVGRTAELAHLNARWGAALHGRGQATLLVGEAGIGKSRLVRGLIDSLADTAHRRIRLYCSPYHTNSPFWPIVDNLKRAAGLRSGDRKEVRLEKLARLTPPATRRDDMALRLIADLLGIETGDSALAEMSAPERRQRTTEALIAQFTTVSGEEPTLIVLEDAHWLDPTTLELVTQLVGCTAESRIMLLVTSRPGFAAPWSHIAQSSELRLNRLGREAASEIIKAVAGKPMPPEIVTEIVEKTDGVPLFIEELTKTVLESGMVRDRGPRFEIARPMVPLSIPSTLQDSLTARLDWLSGVKSVAQFASAIGREFSYSLLAASMTYPEDELQHALDQLVAAQLVQRRGDPPDARFFFTHALVRDTAYQSMLREQRRSCHGAIATTLSLHFSEIANGQPELVAHHFDEADMPGEAVPWWRRAGLLSAHRSATAEAARQFRAALAANARLPEERDTRMTELDLRIMLSGPLIALDGYVSEELEQNYARAWEICEAENETIRAFPVLYGRWVIPYVRGRMKEATDQGRRFLERAEAMEDATLRMVGHRLYGSGLIWLGEPVKGARHLETALSSFDPAQHDELTYIYSQHPRVSARAHLSFALQALGRFDAARDTANAAIEEALEREHFNSIAYALCFAGLLFMLRRQRDDVESRARELLRRSRDKSASYWMLWAEVMLGWVRAADSDVEGGLAAIRDPLSKLEAQRANVWVPQAQLVECELQAERGDHVAAERLEAAARNLVVDAVQGYYLAELHRVSARRRALAGAPNREIEAALAEGLTKTLHRGALGHALPLATAIAEHLEGRGETERAREALNRLGFGPCVGAGTPDRLDYDTIAARLAVTA